MVTRARCAVISAMGRPAFSGRGVVTGRCWRRGVPRTCRRRGARVRRRRTHPRLTLLPGMRGVLSRRRCGRRCLSGGSHVVTHPSHLAIRATAKQHRADNHPEEDEGDDPRYPHPDWYADGQSMVAKRATPPISAGARLTRRSSGWLHPQYLTSASHARLKSHSTGPPTSGSVAASAWVYGAPTGVRAALGNGLTTA
jgi:hypothetical protein